MDKLREIIEYRPKSQKEDFLEYLLERGIDKEEREEILSIILSYFPTHNDWSLVLLIDLSNNEQLISNSLLKCYLSGLLENKSFYIKLSILDYLNATKELYKELNIAIDFSFVEKLAYSKKDKPIVRNQALLLLTEVYSFRKEDLLIQLNKNIEKTKDYKVYIRLYNSLLSNDFYKKFPKNVILHFIEISDKLDLGKAVKIKSEELKLNLLK